MLKIKDLTKKYKVSKKAYFSALNKVSFEINDENMVAIIGESGSGKSTLMNLISTIDTPTNGFVEYDGYKVTFLNDKKRALYRKDNVGFIFQSFNLISDISVLENVAIVMEIAGHKKDERYKRARELLELVGLKDHLNKKPGYLSGGQKQRVAIARALANNPEIILADEPTGALDRTTSQEIMKLLATIAASGKKVIIVTHDMKVASYCERIIRMEDGNIIEDAPNEQEYIDTIDLPTPLERSKGGLKPSGAFKLSSSAFRKRLRHNILLSFGTAIAIASLLIINIATSSIDNYFEDLYRYYGNENTITLMAAPLTYEEDSANIDIEKVVKVDEFEYVEEYAELPTYNAQTQGKFLLEDGTDIVPQAIYPKGIETFGEKELIEGVAPNAENEIVISQDIVKKLNLTNDKAVGETLNLSLILGEEGPTNHEFEIVGVLTDAGIKNNTKTVYFHNDFLKQFGKSDFAFFKQYIVLVEDGKADVVVDDIATKSMEYSEQNVMIFAMRGIQEVSIMEMLLGFTFDIFGMILGVSVFVAAIMIAVMSYVSILERMKEVGVIRAIGGRKRDILGMFTIEAIAIGLFAGIFAAIIGSVVGYVLIEAANSIIDLDVLGADIQLYISPLAIIVVIIGSILLAVASSFISIMKGLAISPVDALKMK